MGLTLILPFQMNAALLIVCCVLILILIISLTAAIIYQTRLNSCNTAKNPWCYKDWKCLTSDAVGTPYIVDSVQTVIDRCTPMFGDAGAQRVARLNAEGCRNLYPGPEWPHCQPLIVNPDTGQTDPDRCRAQVAGDCPPYKLGDVDWTTKTGCVPALGYQPL